MSYPKAWKRFVAASDQVPSAKFIAFSRFAARYRVATTLSEMRFDGLSAQAQMGYTAAFRVAFAYSVLETLGVATRGKDKLGANVIDSALASTYRSPSNRKLHDLLIEDSRGSGLREELNVLHRDAANSDLTPALYAVRNLACHGSLTAYGAGLAKSKTSRQFLEDLASAGLRAADEAFELFLDTHAIGHWDIPRYDTCPSCAASVGRLHSKDCSIALCRLHGEQLIGCLQAGKHRPTTFRGVHHGTVEAMKRGWVVTRGRTSIPDLNRVVAELTWNPDTELFC